MRLAKYDNITGFREEKDVTIHTSQGPVTIKIQALPLTVHRQWLQEAGPRKDDATPLEDAIRDDRYGIYLLTSAVSPGELEFDTDRTKYENDPLGYYDAILAELQAFGFRNADIKHLVNEILAFERLNEGDIDEATEDFLSEVSPQEAAAD